MTVIEFEPARTSAAGSLALSLRAEPALLARADRRGAALARSAGDESTEGAWMMNDGELLATLRERTVPVEPDRFVD